MAVRGSFEANLPDFVIAILVFYLKITTLTTVPDPNPSLSFKGFQE